VKPKTEEFLGFLLWSVDKLMRPTFRNLTDSYESWAYRNGLLRQVATLEEQKLIERNPLSPGERLYRLTEDGRLHALGGRDPEIEWARAWDGLWRMVLFDVPMDRHPHRIRLRRYLRAKHFGCLQGSVWITPHRLGGEREILAGGSIDVETLILLDARPCAGETDEQIVSGAWDFRAINQQYTRYLRVLDVYPTRPVRDALFARALQRWAVEERFAWRAAMEMDPLLPRSLLPSNYPGMEAWQRRGEVLRRAGQHLRDFESFAKL
jgi:DNA-binding transcriptional regulator PaaX